MVLGRQIHAGLAGPGPATAAEHRGLHAAARAGIGATIGLVLGAAIALAARGFLQGRPDSRLQIRSLTYQRGNIPSARFAPDGQTVVYGAAWDGRPVEVFSTRIEGHESRPLNLPSSDILSISSAGEMAVSLNRRYTVGFQTLGTLARVPLGGGAPREILENVQDADWSPDGKELAVVHYVGNRCRLEYPIGKVLYEASAWLSLVRVSPDGRMVAFLDHQVLGDNVGKVRVLDRDGKLGRTLVVGINSDASARRLGKGGDRPGQHRHAADRKILFWDHGLRSRGPEPAPRCHDQGGNAHGEVPISSLDSFVHCGKSLVATAEKPSYSAQ